MTENPLGPKRCVRVIGKGLDPAIDLDNSNTLLYSITREMEHLVFERDKKPVIFEVTKLPRQFIRTMLDPLDGKKPAQRKTAFLAACLRIIRADGTILEPLKTEEGRWGTRIAGDDWLDIVADEFSEDALEEMGMVAVDFARLGKNQAGPFTPRLG